MTASDRPDDAPDRDELRELVKAAGVALKRSELPFALGGGYAAWVRGAPEPTHDADFVLRPEDALAAEEALVEAGLHVEHPPEDWLMKVRPDAGSLAVADVLWRLCDRAVDTDLLERVDTMPVLSVRMPVLKATDVVAGKLAALDEHYCDFARLLPTARALREQVDWPVVAERTAHNPFAAAFLFLLGRLDVADADGGVSRRA